MITLHPTGRLLDSVVGFLALIGAVGGLLLLDHWALTARLLVLMAAWSWVAFNLWGRPPVVTLGATGVTLSSWWGARLHLPWSEVRSVSPSPFDGAPSEATRALVEDLGQIELSFVVDERVLSNHGWFQQSYFALLRAPVDTTDRLTQIRVTVR